MRETYKKINKLLLVIVMVLSYGFLLSNPSIGIDDESFDFYFKNDGLLMSGRWGFYILKKILPTYEYLPVWRDVLALMILLIAVFLMVNCIDKALCRKLPAEVINAIVLTAVSYPIMTRMFIYIDNSLEINIAFLCGVLGYICLSQRQISGLVSGGLLLVMGNAVNENCSIFFCIMMCLMVYFEECNRKSGFFEMIKNNILYVVTLGISLVLETKIGHMLAASKGADYNTSYATASYVMWGRESLEVTLHNFWKGFTANLSYYFERYFSVRLFVIATAVWIITAIVCLVKKEKNKALGIFGGVVFSFSMFIITANGSIPVRIFTTNLILVSTTFVVVHETISKLRFRDDLKRVVFGLLIFYVIFFSSKESNELYQLDYLRYQKDLDVARNVNADIIRCTKGDMQKPVVFLGGTFAYPDINPEGEIALTSIYANNLKGESIRIHKFFEMHGYNYKNPIEQEVTVYNYGDYINNPLTKEAREYASEMPTYPNMGYVEVRDNMVIVKLTDYELE